MARDIDPSGAANPVAVNDPQQAMIDRTPSTTLATMPLPDPTAPANPTGLKGRDRLRDVLKHGPPGISLSKALTSPDYDAWILALPEDPTDIEYTQLLREMKNISQRRQSDMAGKASDGGGASKLLGIDSPAGGSEEPFTWPLAGTASGDAAHQQNRIQKDLEPRIVVQQRKYRDKTGDKPIIMGLQVSDQDALVGNTDPNNPSGTPDGYVSNWAHKQGLSLDNEHAQRAARNGNWVYQGEVDDAAGGPGYTRSVYVYVDDAESQLAGMPPATIKAYQKKLGKPQNGVIDPELQAIWHSAVEMARNYARSGVKVTLDFLFQQQLAAKVAAGGSGGGGGAGRFAGESGAEIVGSDYYQAMMQVLGDISGVKG